MKVCPRCGFKDSPFWKPLFWKLYWEYMSFSEFLKEYPEFTELLNKRFLQAKKDRKFCEQGNFCYHFEDKYSYYKLAGKTRMMVHRFPKGYESMANTQLFEKTPSEKGMPDPFQMRLVDHTK